VHSEGLIVYKFQRNLLLMNSNRFPERALFSSVNQDINIEPLFSPAASKSFKEN